ncbi:MAG TPA: hypothetical protein DCZ92_14100 [Elusimicrobia bacterium]|nr:hypothetical protein [Elusimicrobiota bacterium]
MKKIILAAIAAVFCACSEKGVEKSGAITLQAYPAVEGAAGNKNCKDFMGRCMLFQTEKPLFELSGFAFRARPRGTEDRHNQLEIFLGAEQAAAFGAIPGKFIGEGKRLALVYQGRILHAPKLKARIEAASVTIDFCNEHVYEVLLASLRGKTPPGYKFSDDAAWNMCDPVSEN